MKKYLNVFVAVLLSAITVSFASCSKDDDEPKGGDSGGGTTSLSNMTLTVNGETYYYGRVAFDLGPLMKSYTMGKFLIEEDGTIVCSISAVDKDIDYFEWLDVYRYGDSNIRCTIIEFTVDQFDFKTAKKGQTLSLHTGELQYNSWDSIGYATYYKGGRVSAWYYDRLSSGEVTFVSYQEETDDQDELLILELKGLEYTSPSSSISESIKYEAPSTLSFTGKVMFTNGEFYGVY